MPSPAAGMVRRGMFRWQHCLVFMFKAASLESKGCEVTVLEGYLRALVTAHR